MPLKTFLRRQTDQRQLVSEILVQLTLRDRNHMKMLYAFSTELRTTRTKLRNLETQFQDPAASTVVSRLTMFSA
jgi:hypothetical protein